MGRKLSQMTSAEFKAELSIAGSPDKMMGLLDKIMIVANEVDRTNIAELINLQLIFKRAMADVALWERMERQRQHP